VAEPVDAPGALNGAAGPSGDPAPSGVIIDNRTDLPDAAIREAVMAHWVETAALQFGTPTTFQMYATGQGQNMLSRSPFRTPSNVIEEIKLARQVVDTDDDVYAVLNSAIAIAFGDGMQNQHEDEATLALFNELCGPAATGGMNLDSRLKEMYREYLIAGQINTLSLFTRTRFSFTPSGTESAVNAQIATPVPLGIVPAEHIRVLDMDIFGTSDLAYDPEGTLKDWLDTYFGKATSAAVKAKMGREQPILAAMFTGPVEVPWNDTDMFSAGKTVYRLNPRMVHRSTMPKGASPYPRPPLTSNFALLEAKRLLNIMDYALLQGGTNYIVVAKVGSDKLPAQQPEVDNLTDQVRAASRTGVLVGDHRVDIEIITPDLTELLNPAKRKLIGRKIAMALLRIPEQVTGDPGSAGATQELEFTARTITSDRRDIKRHVEGFVYEEIVKRNPSTFKKGTPKLWFPRIILSGIKDFNDAITKARDRGDIPRKYAVEALGFDYEAAVAQREREKENGDDELMTPGSVPFSGDMGAPAADGGAGRPVGSSSNNGRPGAAAPSPDPAQRQRQLIPRRRGEPVRAIWDEEAAEVVRYGELTAAVLEEYPDHTVGRVSSIEREAVEAGEVTQRGPVAVVPVNPGYEVRDLRVFRLDEGASLIVGQRTSDGAMVAKALSFREPQFKPDEAEEIAVRWGFVTVVEQAEEVSGEVVPAPQPSIVAQIVEAIQGISKEELAALGAGFATALAKIQPSVTVVMPEEGDTEFVRDEHGAITGKRRVRSE
jgi:hypothetical protein